MARRKLKIDLLLRQDFTKKSSGKLLLWALTVGRYIAIFTELVVIAGVIARFTLDYQRNRITEDILEQQTIVSSYKPVELQARRLNSQLSEIARLERQRLHAAEMLQIISDLTPTDLRFDSFELSEDSVDIKGNVLSSQGLAKFLTGLQTLPNFSDILLKSVETGGLQDPSIHFSVSVQFLQTAATKSQNKSS